MEAVSFVTCGVCKRCSQAMTAATCRRAVLHASCADGDEIAFSANEPDWERVVAHNRFERMPAAEWLPKSGHVAAPLSPPWPSTRVHGARTDGTVKREAI